MASISLTDPVAATTVTAGLHAGNNAALRTAINGGLDSTNIASLTWAKLALNRGTSFPGSPADGEQYVYTADATNGVQWTFKYNSGSASAFKWEYVGGSAMRNAVETSENTASAVNADLATPQSITLPRSGDYDVTFGSAQASNTLAGNAMTIALTIAAAEITTAAFTSPGVNYAEGLSKTFRMTGRAANDVLKEQYRVAAGTGTFASRFMFVTPVRVS